MRARLVAGVAIILTGAIPAPARAAIPDAAHSFVARHLVICPAGDSMLVVVVRRADATPWDEGPAWVNVCGCPGLRLSSVPLACAVPDTSACHVTMMPDSYGVVEIPISGGGLCPGGTVWVAGGGVPLALLGEPACFDQNGDLKVDGADVAIVNSKIGTHDPGADFDGDGTITALDLAILLQHFGHASLDAGPAPAKPPR
jgi:hypothetical protein